MITTFQIVASHYFDITDMWIRRKSIYSLNIKYLNMVLTLHYFPSQARGEAIRLILEYGKIPFENVIVPYQWDEIKASGDISPFGQLPTLRLNSGVVIAETNAIIRYVAKLAGIYPADVDECAQADMLLELATSDLMGINPIFNRYPVDGPEFGVKKAEYFAKFPAYLKAIEKILGTKQFFGGEVPHFGDFALYHILNLATTIEPSSLSGFPSLSQWMKSLEAIPSVAAYLKNRPTPPDIGRVGSFSHSLLKP